MALHFAKKDVMKHIRSFKCMLTPHLVHSEMLNSLHIKEMTFVLIFFPVNISGRSLLFLFDYMYIIRPEICNRSFFPVSYYFQCLNTEYLMNPFCHYSLNILFCSNIIASELHLTATLTELVWLIIMVFEK